MNYNIKYPLILLKLNRSSAASAEDLFYLVQIILSYRSLLFMKFEYATVFLHGYIASLESTYNSFILVTCSLDTKEVM
jgi:hypothetical protein